MRSPGRHYFKNFHICEPVIDRAWGRFAAKVAQVGSIFHIRRCPWSLALIPSYDVRPACNLVHKTYKAIYIEARKMRTTGQWSTLKRRLLTAQKEKDDGSDYWFRYLMLCYERLRDVITWGERRLQVARYVRKSFDHDGVVVPQLLVASNSMAICAKTHFLHTGG